MKLIFLILTSLLLVGCGGGYKITYNTMPEGASLLCNNKNWGYTPKTLKYDIDNNTKEAGYFNPSQCYAKWSSGVQENFNIRVDIDKWPDGVMYTIQRPEGGDYAQDANFALNVQNMKNQQQAQEAMQWQALNQSIQLQNMQTQQQLQNLQLRNTINLRRFRY
jgi:hypothetical protein